MVENKPPCRICDESANVYMVKRIISNGAVQVLWYCYSCKRSALAGKYLPHNGIDIDALPLLADYRDPGHLCEVCGALGAEIHHWAPRHLFGNESDAWPTSYLCIKCHLRWHGITTPEMYKNGLS